MIYLTGLFPLTDHDSTGADPVPLVQGHGDRVEDVLEPEGQGQDGGLDDVLKPLHGHDRVEDVIGRQREVRRLS